MLIFRYIVDNFIICYYIYRVKWWTWIADIEMENFEQQIPHLEEYKTWQALKSGEVIPAKRKSAGDAEVSYIPSKKKKISGPVQTKNAVQALNEYKTGGWRGAEWRWTESFAGLLYSLLSQSGPSHAPHFVMGVTLNGTQFTGTGGWVVTLHSALATLEKCPSLTL